MEWFYLVLSLYVFVLGCCIGSFVNVAALRLPEGKSFVKGRSECPLCGAQLHACELIPLFSYLFLRGKCRSCKGQISPRYPVVEAACGFLFLLCFWWYGFSYEALLGCLIVSLLLCVFLVDAGTMTIPNGLVLAFFAPCALDLLLTGLDGIWWRVLGFFVVSVPMLLLSKFIPGSFGGGDIKLIAVCGFLLGTGPVLFAAFLAIVSCGFAAIGLLVSKRVKKGTHIAFGPYLAAGILLARLFYEPVINTYLSWLQ